MPECTDTERKMLDFARKADVIWMYQDDSAQTFAVMRAYDQRPPSTISVDYEHIEGERVVRRVAMTLGLTAKQFTTAVRRGKSRDEQA